MPVETKVIALGDSRVRVEVEVSSEEIERELMRHAEGLGKGRVLAAPHFSRGKPPGTEVIERAGRDRVLGDTLRRQIPRWYGEAITEADVKTVGHPTLDMDSDLPEAGDPFRFSFEVLVKPKARLGPYKGLEVARREPEGAFREAVVDAAVEAAIVELSDEVVAAAAEEVWERFEEALSKDESDTMTYLDAAGKTLEQAIDDAKPEAARELARESVLEAIAEVEGIDDPDQSLRLRKVIDLLVEHAIPIR